MSNTEQTVDTLETMLILAMSAKSDSTIKDINHRVSAKTSIYEFDANKIFKFPKRLIRSAYTADLTGDRLFVTEAKELLTHPAEIYGSTAEVLLLTDDRLKWTGFNKLNKKPNSTFALGKASHWYEMHYREVFINGTESYVVRPTAFDSKGNTLRIKLCDTWLDHSKNYQITAVTSASLIEDAHRSNAMLATVSEVDVGVELKFPVPLDAYKELFALRDGPYTSSRRKAILHWVAKHLRKGKDDKKIEVKQHTRGVSDFVLDGLKIHLTVNGR